jgi:hypothetical protein
MNDNITKLYLGIRGTVGLSTSAIKLLGLEITNDSFVGFIHDKVDDSFYLYESTPTSTDYKRKIHYSSQNNSYYFTIKVELMSILFKDVVGTYLQMALEEEPYEINGVQCYKIISRKEAETFVESK